MPQWQLSLNNIPLMAPDTLVIGEEFSDSSLIVDSDSLYHLWFTGSEQIELAHHLRLGPLNPGPISGMIDEVRVSGNPGQTLHVAIFDALPQLQVLNNTTAEVPTLDLQVTKTLDLDNYCSVTLSEGTVTVSIVNNLTFDLGLPLRATLYDRSLGQEISVLDFNAPVLANGGSQQAVLDLAGKTLTNALQVIVQGSIPGTQDKSVYLTENHGFDITVSMTDLVAVAAEAKIPPQFFYIEHDLDLSTDSLVIASAEISGGSINFEIASEFTFPVQLDMTLPGVLDNDRQPYHRMFDLLSGSIEQIEIDLTGRTVQMLNGLLQIDVQTTLLPEPEDYVRVKAGDSYRFAASVSELTFSSVTASVDLMTEFPHIREEVMDTDISIPEILFNEAVFTLFFRNVPANMALDLYLDAITGINENATAAYQINIPGGTERQVTISNTGVLVDGVPSGTGGGLMDVINLFPKEFAFNGSARIQDNYVTMNGSPIDMDYQLDVPFVFSVPQETVLSGDTSRIDLSEEEQDKLKDVNDLQLQCDVLNGLGLGGVFKLIVADSVTARTRPLEAWAELSSIRLQPATTDEYGNCIAVNAQQLAVSMTDEQIRLLINSDYMTWTFKLDSVEMAKLKSTDYVVVEKACLTGSMTVNTGDDE